MVAVSLKKFFFFKQKTAYEMCPCDWSSDVCSSDLQQAGYLAWSSHLSQGEGGREVIEQAATYPACCLVEMRGGLAYTRISHHTRSECSPFPTCSLHSVNARILYTQENRAKAQSKVERRGSEVGRRGDSAIAVAGICAVFAVKRKERTRRVIQEGSSGPESCHGAENTPRPVCI